MTPPSSMVHFSLPTSAHPDRSLPLKSGIHFTPGNGARGACAGRIVLRIKTTIKLTNAIVFIRFSPESKGQNSLGVLFQHDGDLLVSDIGFGLQLWHEDTWDVSVIVEQIVA